MSQQPHGGGRGISSLLKTGKLRRERLREVGTRATKPEGSSRPCALSRGDSVPVPPPSCLFLKPRYLLFQAVRVSSIHLFPRASCPVDAFWGVSDGCCVSVNDVTHGTRKEQPRVLSTAPDTLQWGPPSQFTEAPLPAGRLCP